MSKLWIGNKLYSVKSEVRDHVDCLEGLLNELTDNKDNPNGVRVKSIIIRAQKLCNRKEK